MCHMEHIPTLCKIENIDNNNAKLNFGDFLTYKMDSGKCFYQK